MKSRSKFCLALAAAACSAAPAQAATVYGVNDADQLVSFASGNPGQVSSPLAITGLQAGETIRGIDFRPATLQLVALGSTGRLYRVDTVTGAATVLSTLSTALVGTEFGIDFNPTVDRLRVVSDADQNLRINPANGATTVDGTLAYAAGDPNFGDNPAVSAVAYTNNFPASSVYPATPTTTLYGIDTDNDVLVTQNPPNNGTLNTVGALGADVTAVSGFDIQTLAQGGGNVAYAVLRIADGRSRLYTIDLATGTATAVGGPPAAASQIKDVAVAPAVPTFVALTSGTPQGLTTFRADRPEAAGLAVAISGLQVGERLVGIDTRPADGQLYGVGSTSRLYTLDPATGVATPANASAFTPALSGEDFGVDFNPAADRLRVNSDAEQNLRIDVGANTVTTDTPLAYSGGVPADPNVTAAAYTNSVSGAAATLLYDIDTSTNQLLTQNPPNNGTLNVVGPLGVDPTDVNGFDILPRFNHQFAAFQLAGETGSKLYAVNVAATPGGTPANGAAVLAGQIGLPAGTLAEGLTVFNPDRIALGSSAASTGEGNAVTLTVIRSGDTDAGPATVKVTTADGTASSSDYTATTTTVAFAAGETARTITVATTEDTADEADETFTVTLSTATGGAAIGSPSVATVTVTDDDDKPVATPTATPTPAPTAAPTATPTPTPAPYVLPRTPKLTAAVTPKRDRTFPYRFTTRGKVTPPAGLTNAACKGARVTVQVKVKGRQTTLSNRTVKLSSTCTYVSRVTLSVRRRLPKRGTLQFTVRFQGTSTLKAVRVVRTARIG